MATAALRPIHDTRRKNLSKLIKERFEDNASECARAIKRSHTYLWQLVSGHRAIGEESARYIEHKLNLALYDLDKADGLKRTKELTVHDGSGGTLQFRMVARYAMEDLHGVLDHVPCPLSVEECSDKTFCATVDAEPVQELEPDDRIFVDPARAEARQRKLFVVHLKGRPKHEGVVLVAKRRAAAHWVFGETSSRTEYKSSDLDIIGQVILIVRVPK